MAKFNLTVDDFDPLVHYANYEDWTTPNPQDHPDWWNATQEVTGSPYHQATYHSTSKIGSEVSFNFTGSALWIYGDLSDGGCYYNVKIDDLSSSSSTQGDTGAIWENGAPGREASRKSLWSNDSLSYEPHTVTIKKINGTGSLMLDMFVVQMELGAEGATITNTTLDDRAPEIKYDGTWTGQDGPNFHNQTSTYTGGPNNAMEVSFAGSAVWIYGDQVNDHGEFSVYLNDSSTPVATHNGRSGCGGGYAKACEKLHGLAFFAGNLPEGTHKLRLVNGGPSEGNTTFFDFDYLEYAVPSTYSNQKVDGPAACASQNCTSGTGGSNSASSGSSGSVSSSGPSSTATKPATGGNAASHSASNGTGVLAMVLGAWVLRKLLA